MGRTWPKSSRVSVTELLLGPVLLTWNLLCHLSSPGTPFQSPMYGIIAGLGGWRPFLFLSGMVKSKLRVLQRNNKSMELYCRVYHRNVNKWRSIAHWWLGKLLVVNGPVISNLMYNYNVSPLKVWIWGRELTNDSNGHLEKQTGENIQSVFKKMRGRDKEDDKFVLPDTKHITRLQ